MSLDAVPVQQHVEECGLRLPCSDFVAATFAVSHGPTRADLVWIEFRGITRPRQWVCEQFGDDWVEQEEQRTANALYAERARDFDPLEVI